MTWGNKERDWYKIVSEIQSELNANKDIIPAERLADIQHYIDHDEYSMAFEYLYLEIMERDRSLFTLGEKKAREIGILFDLNDEDECMIDAKFWAKFEIFLRNRDKNI